MDLGQCLQGGNTLHGLIRLTKPLVKHIHGSVIKDARQRLNNRVAGFLVRRAQTGQGRLPVSNRPDRLNHREAGKNVLLTKRLIKRVRTAGLPDSPQRRRYHHAAEDEFYTYKQDYARIFTASNLYSEIARQTFDATAHGAPWNPEVEASNRGMCALLRKSTTARYPVAE